MTRQEQLRFNRLVQHFVHRFVDNEMIAAGGEVHQTFVTAMSLLGGAGFTLALVISLRYFFLADRLKVEAMRWMAMSDQLLLILLVMAATGLFTVIGWDALFPDKRDAMVLGVLPLETRTILGARLYAIGLFFCVLVAMMQIFPGLVAPVAMYPGRWLTAMLVQAVVLTAAAALVFFGAMAAQGLLLLALPYRWFLRASSGLQMMTLLGSLSMLVLTPEPALAARHGLWWTGWLPSYWFLSMWRRMMGEGGTWLAGVVTAGVVVVALSTFMLGYRHAMRKVVEGAPERSGPGWRRWSLNWWPGEPRERAIFLFVARTMARHRAHRLLLAAYVGTGLVWVLSEVSVLLERGLTKATLAPNPVTCMIPLDLAFFVLAGLRVLFSLPAELPANWMFRLTAPGHDAAMARGVRRFLIVAGILPLAIIPAPLLAAAWGWQVAAMHTGIYLLETWLLLELMMRNFHKVPFTCSWMPGQGNLKVKLGIYWILFGGLSSMLGAVESQALRGQGATAMWVFGAMMAAGIAWTRWQGNGPWQFEFEARDERAGIRLELAR